MGVGSGVGSGVGGACLMPGCALCSARLLITFFAEVGIGRNFRNYGRRPPQPKYRPEIRVPALGSTVLRSALLVQRSGVYPPRPRLF